MIQILGWSSSFILLITIAIQLHKQWKEKTSRGVSTWLFVGQVAAETGFVTYSFILRDWVFVVTNTLLLVENFIGLYLTLRFKNKT